MQLRLFIALRRFISFVKTSIGIFVARAASVDSMTVANMEKRIVFGRE